MTRWFSIVAAGGAVLLTVAVGSAGATTFAGKVDPPGAGTTSAPKAHTVTFETQNMKAGPDGNPTVGANTLEQILPADFAAAFDRYGTCDKAEITTKNDQPKCPDNSLLGTIKTVTYLPDIHQTSTSDKGFVWKTGPDTFGGWAYASKPSGIGFAIYGKLTAASGGTGPVAVWDFSPGVRREVGGLEARVKGFLTNWTASGTTTAATPAPAQPSSAASNKRRLARCLRKARRIHNRSRRRARIRACRRAARRRAQAQRPSTAPAPAGAFSPFMSTACNGGAWNLQVHIAYADGSNEALESKVDCATGAGSSSDTGPGGLPCPPSPLPCPSVPLAAARWSARQDG